MRNWTQPRGSAGWYQPPSNQPAGYHQSLRSIQWIDRHIQPPAEPLVYRPAPDIEAPVAHTARPEVRVPLRPFHSGRGDVRVRYYIDLDDLLSSLRDAFTRAGLDIRFERADAGGVQLVVAARPAERDGDRDLGADTDSSADEGRGHHPDVHGQPHPTDRYLDSAADAHAGADLDADALTDSPALTDVDSDAAAD